MNIQIFGKPKCFETKKAQRWFKERRIKYQDIDLPRFGMSRGELQSVLRAAGGLDALLNESHPDSALVKYLAHEDDKQEKLMDCPALIKTPIVRNGKLATVGFAPEIWEKWE